MAGFTSDKSGAATSTNCTCSQLKMSHDVMYMSMFSCWKHVVPQWDCPPSFTSISLLWNNLAIMNTFKILWSRALPWLGWLVVFSPVLSWGHRLRHNRTRHHVLLYSDMSNILTLPSSINEPWLKTVSTRRRPAMQTPEWVSTTSARMAYHQACSTNLTDGKTWKNVWRAKHDRIR
jgi:hypothetical protein